MYTTSRKKINKRADMGCGGLSENGPHRLIDNVTIRRGDLGVDMAL